MKPEEFKPLEELDTVFEEDQSASIQLETDEEDHLEAIYSDLSHETEC